jgi:hypothetical protein
VFDPLRWPAGLVGVDLAGTCARIDTVLKSRGFRSQATSQELLIQFAHGERAAMATIVAESDRIARAVVSHIRLAPWMNGIALAIHPRVEVDAPMMIADVFVVPPLVTRAVLDACGPSITGPGFSAMFARPLAAMLDSAQGVHRSTIPAWMAPLSGGGGGRLRARGRAGTRVCDLLVRYIDRYLVGVGDSPTAHDVEANRASARQVREAALAHGRASKYLAKAFGESFAKRYLDLLWNIA